jgi:hypothetical protein
MMKDLQSCSELLKISSIPRTNRSDENLLPPVVVTSGHLRVGCDIFAPRYHKDSNLSELELQIKDSPPICNRREIWLAAIDMGLEVIKLRHSRAPSWENNMPWRDPEQRVCRGYLRCIAMLGERIGPNRAACVVVHQKTLLLSSSNDAAESE